MVGGSLAGVRGAQGLRRHGFDGELTVVSAESGAPYDRPPLSKAFLAGEVNRDVITLTSREALDVTWLEGTRATASICGAAGLASMALETSTGTAW